SANPAAVGQAVTFTATVRGPAGTGTPTGTVTFLVNGRAVARVTLDAQGQARIRGFFSIAGLFTIQAVYSRDANFSAPPPSPPRPCPPRAGQLSGRRETTPTAAGGGPGASPGPAAAWSALPRPRRGRCPDDGSTADWTGREIHLAQVIVQFAWVVRFSPEP